MSKKLFISLFISLLIATIAYAQTVDEIIDKMNSSKGSSEAYAKISSWKVTGSVSVMGQSVPFLLFLKKPDMFRMEQDMMGQKVIQTYDGKEGWMINPMTGSDEPQQMDQTTIDQMKDMKDVFEEPYKDYKTKGIKIEYLGKEKIEANDYYKLKITDKTSESTVWVDVNTYYPYKQLATISQMGQSFDAETIFLDYKEYSGIIIPTTMNVSVMNMNIVNKFEKIEFNLAMDDSLFKKP
jgi:hypothetical protein